MVLKIIIDHVEKDFDEVQGKQHIFSPIMQVYIETIHLQAFLNFN